MGDICLIFHNRILPAGLKMQDLLVSWHEFIKSVIYVLNEYNFLESNTSYKNLKEITTKCKYSPGGLPVDLYYF